MESFQTLIHEFGKQIHVEGDMHADEEGYLALTFDSQLIHLQYDEQLDEVTVFTRLGEIEPNRLTDICLMLLAANTFWQGTQGATFSVEPSTKMVFLAERQAFSLVGGDRLKDWLERFLNIADYWNKRLLTANSGGSLAPEFEVSKSFLSNINIRKT